MLTRTSKYGLTHHKLAQYLGYSSTAAFTNSSAKQRLLKGIELIIKDVEKKIIQDIDI